MFRLKSLINKIPKTKKNNNFEFIKQLNKPLFKFYSASSIPPEEKDINIKSNNNSNDNFNNKFDDILIGFSLGFMSVFAILAGGHLCYTIYESKKNHEIKNNESEKKIAKSENN